MTNNLVSIITPIFNSCKWVDNLLDIILSQTYANWEWIVIDDCSSDDTYNRISKIAESDPRIKVFKNIRNLGPAETRNIGIKLSTGRFISFLDADDEWEPNKLELQINYMIINNFYMSYHDYRHMSFDGSKVGDVVKGPEKLDWKTHHIKRGIGCLTIMFDRTLGDLPYFPELSKNIIAEDFLAWSNVLKNNAIAYRVPYDLARYRLSNKARSSNKLYAAYSVWYIYYCIEKIPLLKSLFFWAQYAINATVLHKKSRPYIELEKK